MSHLTERNWSVTIHMKILVGPRQGCLGAIIAYNFTIVERELQKWLCIVSANPYIAAN